jgi:hypothetical protein
MQRIVLAIAFMCATPGIIFGQDVIVHARRVKITAQEQAEENARTGRLTHCRVLNGVREGIGMGPTPLAAERACCFYNDAMRGRYRIVEKGVAWSPVRRAWFAVIRYE